MSSLDEMMDIVTHAAIPACVIALAALEIRALSPSFGQWEDDSVPVLEMLVDHRAHALLRAGEIEGYESEYFVPELKETLRIWTRALGRDKPPEHALVVVAEPTLPMLYSALRHVDVPPIIGTIDATMHIDRISKDVHVLGHSPRELVGASLLGLLREGDVPHVIMGIAQAITAERGVSVDMLIQTTAGGTFDQIIVTPLSPSLSCAFVLVGKDQRTPSVNQTEATLHQLGQGSAQAAYDLTHAARLAQLSRRETDVLERLVNGERVNVIADALFVSQSTVRNHLSSIFRKCGVSSQQDLLRLIASTNYQRNGRW